MALTQPDQETLLLKQPTLSATNIAFLYAGELWIAEKDGGHPHRLTAQFGQKLNPVFSPDGQWIAFSGNYDGNLSVYIIPRGGGSPRRLTYHPGEDLVRGWTHDGKHVLFASARETIMVRSKRLYTVPIEGGHPAALPMPTAERASYSPDGQRIAYTPYVEAFWSWKRYRGGQTVPIWVFDLNTYNHIEVPHENASDTFPCWVGNSIYFLSDRCGIMNLFCFDINSQTINQVTFHPDFDVRSLTSGAGMLAYEQAGRVHIFDPAAQQSNTLSIAISADLPATRPHYRKAAHFIQNCGLSPTGARAVIEARGDILTVPVKKGEVRNLTRTTGVCERDPAWSPDGKSIAYYSDASGEYELVISDQKGMQRRIYPLGKHSFFYAPIWSPDSKRIAFTDKALNLAYIDLETKEINTVDTDTYDHPVRSLNPSWSPDSQWLVYTKRLDNHLRAVFLYHLPTAKIHQVTDGMSDTIDACFSKDGKYIFFAASGNFGLNTGWLDMSSFERPIIRSLYVVVLSKDQPSPLAPESDEETEEKEEDKEEKAEDKAKETDTQVPLPATNPVVESHESTALPTEETGEKDPKAGETEKESRDTLIKIDLEGLDQRILTLPVPARDYCRLQAAEGKLFYLETAPYQTSMAELAPTSFMLNVYDLKERKSELYLPRVRDYWVSADGKKILVRFGFPGDFAIVSVEKKPDPGEGSLDLDSADILVNPIEEWQQMFQEAYRIHRDYFYDPGMHGLDLEATYQKYLQFLPHVGHRDDLNYLLAEFSGELVAGHAYVMYGDIPAPATVSVGLLGADYEVVAGMYRIKRIYRGLNWIPELRAPLTEPGVNVQPGEYILAVNGQPLRAPADIYSLFQKTADRITELSISPTPDETEARSVLVRPIYSETALRLWHWIEENRKKVDSLTGGRVAYVYMSDTLIPGYESINRYYFSQLDKQAVILDERFNGGGAVADYVIDLLDRPVLSYWATRDGKEFPTPNASIFGPKAMIINEMAGSGGDALPLFFRRRGLGKLIGKRTWGGLIGIFDYPPLMDGGMLTSPRLAIYSPDGRWEVENEGISPDIEVEFTPKLVIEGHDPQLEKAVEVVLEELEAHPPVRVPRPAPAKRAIMDLE